MRLVNSRTGAVITTHFHGLASGTEELASYCAEKHTPLIEDAAQAFGGYVNGKALGSFGDVGIFSFGRVKNVNSFYGGAVVCRDRAGAAGIRSALAELPYEAISRLVKRLAHCLIGDLLTNPVIFRVLTFWIVRYACLREVQSVNKLVQTEEDPVPRTEVPEVYKRCITPMQARLIGAQLDRVNEQTAERIARAQRYGEGLADLQQIMRPPHRQYATECLPRRSRDSGRLGLGVFQAISPTLSTQACSPKSPPSDMPDGILVGSLVSLRPHLVGFRFKCNRSTFQRESL
jgi:perosamine synthetase